jgi:hypothetical protein
MQYVNLGKTSSALAAVLGGASQKKSFFGDVGIGKYDFSFFP